MINLNNSATYTQFAGPRQKPRKMALPVARKPSKDPMKLFPYLFQFASTRLSETDPITTGTGKAAHHHQRARRPLFLAFRSPNDQQCVISLHSFHGDDRPVNVTSDWIR
jgi:hypothetical protein